MLNLVILSLMKSTENFLWITRGVKKRMERVVNEFRAIYEKYSTKNEDYCLVFVGIVGITELLLNALEQIMDEERESGELYYPMQLENISFCHKPNKSLDFWKNWKTIHSLSVFLRKLASQKLGVGVKKYGKSCLTISTQLNTLQMYKRRIREKSRKSYF